MACYLLGKGYDAVVSLAPRGHHDASPGLEHPRHLLHVRRLVGHVLTALAGPHVVEAIIGEGHRQCVHHLKLHVARALLLRQSGGALGLVARQCDAGDLHAVAQLLR
jgi:hypothetical protein